MKYMMLPMLLLMTVAAAEEKKIYKYTDENGVTHYSETKLNDDYHEADLPPLSIVPSTPVKNRPQSVSQQDEAGADPSAETELTIVQPAHEENLWGTGGKVTAQINELAVALQESNQVQFIIDGKKQPPADGLTQVFDGIFRGEHTLKARVINRYNKKVIKESKAITFYMHQNSKK